MIRDVRARLYGGRHGVVRVAVAVGLFAVTFMGAPEAVQSQQRTPSPTDPAAVLQRVLPHDVAARILALAADARTHGLPADALLQRALKFAARGIPPADIERSVAEHVGRLSRAKTALDHARTRAATADEIEAGAEAIREGVDAGTIGVLAKSVLAGRSLAVPLYVMGNLTALGLPAKQALARVRAKLDASATDGELESLAAQVTAAADNTANDAATHAAGHGAAGQAPDGVGSKGVGGGPPAGVPGNGGAKAHPPHPPHPVTPGNNGGGGNGNGNGNSGNAGNGNNGQGNGAGNGNGNGHSNKP